MKCKKHDEELVFRSQRWRCRTCQLARQRDHYARNRKQEIAKRRVRAVRVKLEHYQIVIDIKSVPCADCKKIYPHYIMEFDHITKDKINNVSAMVGGNFEKLVAEIAKCEIVCSNCHSERTWQRNHAPLV